MKNIAVFLFALFVVNTAGADASKHPIAKKKADFSKYCYYDDLAYSLGSVMIQANTKMRCGKDKTLGQNQSGNLVWLPVTNKKSPI